MSNHLPLSVSKAVKLFCDEWLRINNHSAKTIAAYRIDLRQFVETIDGDMPLIEMDVATIKQWVLHLQDSNYRPATIHRKIASLRAFCTYATVSDLLQNSPFVKFKLRIGENRRLTRVVPENGVMRMLEDINCRILLSRGSFKTNALACRDYAIVRILGATGIRVGELCGIKCEDIVEGHACLRIIGKGDRERLALLVHDEDRSCLARYISVREVLRPSTHVLFVNSHGYPLTTEGVRRIVRLSAESSGIRKRVTPHMLRHTAATKLLERGADIRIIQKYLGHRSIRSTERYTHVSTELLRSAVSRYHPLQATS